MRRVLDALIPQKHEVVVYVEQSNESAIERLRLGLAKQIQGLLGGRREARVHFLLLKSQLGFVHLLVVNYGVFWLFATS